MELDNLSNLGQSYQSKTIYSLISDKSFLETVDDILYPDYFESEANQWIVKVIKNYFNTYKIGPTIEVFKAEYEKEKNDLLKNEILSKLKDVYESEVSTDLQYIKDNFINFCINQHYKISLYQSIDDIKKGDYESIKKRFDDASKVGKNKHLGLDLLKLNPSNVFKTLKRDTIITPWDTINNITEGGLGKGELIIAVGGPGSGKTWALCAVGVQALKLGLTVNHYTLELSEGMVAKRYYSLLTDISSADLMYSLDEIDHKVDALQKKGSNLVITNYPTKTATVNTIKAHIDKCIQLGQKPDMIIVDYGDLLKAPTFYKEKRLEIGNIFEELRGLAGLYQIPVWTASQSNRSGAEGDYISGEQVSEDYSKIMIGDFIFSISRKLEDTVHKTARVYIIKNRFGADKILFPAKFDVSNGNLNIYESESMQGKDAKTQMEDSKKSNLKQLLREKISTIHLDNKE